MLDILERWNHWGHAKLPAGHLRRKLLAKMVSHREGTEITTLIGPRRAGKSTLLYQVIQHLEQTGVEKKAILHINFEEPALAPFLTLELLDKLYNIYRQEIYPEGKAYLFLDEIQNIPEWERWVRARNETENIKIFITGSSGKIMSRELGTLLTGRHLTFKIYPLSFSEILEFNHVELPYPTLVSASKKIEYELMNYLRFGGFPAVVTAQSIEKREQLLIQYFEDILYRDIALRHSIRDLSQVRQFAAHLLAHTGSLLSASRLGKVFGISTELAAHYCSYLQEAFLIGLVPYFSLKAAERTRNPHKIHVIDPGIRNVIALTASSDLGHAMETLVYLSLIHDDALDVYYWRKNKEVDFLVRKKNQTQYLIQVVYTGLDDEKIRMREIAALLSAREMFPKTRCLLITHHLPQSTTLFAENKITLIPLWKFLLFGLSEIQAI
ncbi:MAG: hypothetical protein A3F10_07140 [Coxiella sp. RIFCSPHIGHO2_12_FULL_42_15]|nr:MAG: hypothetical protein A3F10_07140 [Coxiella sp. RIFCSPHIGHO2_12_FULL_42_15]